jgi:hypothetical protein
MKTLHSGSVKAADNIQEISKMNKITTSNTQNFRK